VSSTAGASKPKPIANIDKGFWDETSGNAAVPYASSNYTNNVEKPVESNTNAVKNYQNPYQYKAPPKTNTASKPSTPLFETQPNYNYQYNANDPPGSISRVVEPAYAKTPKGTNVSLELSP
jgi:hypothetical protein